MTDWQHEEDLIAVRDPNWLAALSPTDRRRRDAFWQEVDELITASLSPIAPPPRAKGE